MDDKVAAAERKGRADRCAVSLTPRKAHVRVAGARTYDALWRCRRRSSSRCKLPRDGLLHTSQLVWVLAPNPYSESAHLVP